MNGNDKQQIINEDDGKSLGKRINELIKTNKYSTTEELIKELIGKAVKTGDYNISSKGTGTAEYEESALSKLDEKSMEFFKTKNNAKVFIDTYIRNLIDTDKATLNYKSLKSPVVNEGTSYFNY